MGTSKEERRRRYPVEGERRRARPCCITTSTRVGSGLGTATCGGNTRRKRFKPVVDESYFCVVLSAARRRPIFLFFGSMGECPGRRLRCES